MFTGAQAMMSLSIFMLRRHTGINNKKGGAIYPHDMVNEQVEM